MAEDKWYEIVNDDIGDIALCVEKTKSQYWQKAWIMLACTIAGSAVMGLGKANGIIAVGCFLAASGMVGVFALATMSHAQLCLDRAIKEIRQGKDASE